MFFLTKIWLVSWVFVSIERIAQVSYNPSHIKLIMWLQFYIFQALVTFEVAFPSILTFEYEISIYNQLLNPFFNGG